MDCGFQGHGWVLCLEKVGEYEALTSLHMIKEKEYNFFKNAFQDMICLKEKILDVYLTKRFFF